MDPKSLFLRLFKAPTERHVDEIISQDRLLSDERNWKPYGQNDSNFGVVENQQASPIPALVEKVINAIDAILTRECLERQLSPKSDDAPRSVDLAIERFFPEAPNWDLPKRRQLQAERIQIIADGPRMETSLTIYDDGEGQHPRAFEDTFLSLLRGNKNEIHFVQGKYNMGGAGAIAFCGKKRYQLLGSRKWDKSGDFGFTVIRRHPLNEQEKRNRRATWYEYFVLNSQVPSFSITTLDLGLRKRLFTTGTVIKLYSYDLPAGTRSVISRDLNQSLNEYLFSPALPLFTIDRPNRYPKDRNLQRDLYGLKHRLELDDSKYVDEFFSEQLVNQKIGVAKVFVYVFKPKVEDKSARETRDTIRREFFKNNMSVIFSVNGQAHGHYTSEFITRRLKYQILKDHLLIHVDCTDMDLDFRNELFMASRDRLKEGQESRELRDALAELLVSGRLRDVYKERKASITVEGKDTDDLLRSFANSLPLRDELVRLLDDAMTLGEGGNRKRVEKQPRQSSTKRNAKPKFLPKRFPSFLRLQHGENANGTRMIKIPRGGSRTVRLSTDAEDQYFDRVSEPGDLTIGILDYTRNGGGRGRRQPSEVTELLNVIKSSPQAGTIRLVVNPTAEVTVGDSIRVQARLSGAGQNFDEVFLVKITDPEKKSAPTPKGKDEPSPNPGLPQLVLVHKDEQDDGLSWEQLGNSGIEMNHRVVVFPSVDEKDLLDKIYVNMDSRVLLDHRSRLSTQEQIEVAQKRYVSAVYFHTLFLYSITKNRQYRLEQTKQGDNQGTQEVTVDEYLRDLFESHYAEFLLNFEMQELIAAFEA